MTRWALLIVGMRVCCVIGGMCACHAGDDRWVRFKQQGGLGACCDVLRWQVCLFGDKDPSKTGSINIMNFALEARCIPIDELLELHRDVRLSQ